MTLLIGTLGLMSFSGIKFALAESEAGCCTECTDSYCSSPYNPETGEGDYTQPGGTYCICPPTGSTDLEGILNSVIGYVFMIATVITPILILIGGFYFMTSGGEIERVNTAKRIITYTVIGYSIILFSRGLVYILKDILGAP